MVRSCAKASGGNNLADNLVAESLRDSDFDVSERRRYGDFVFADRPMKRLFCFQVQA
jgi:hypothetical protein